MKITKSQLEQIIKEEINRVNELAIIDDAKQEAKNKITAWIKSHAEELSEFFPWGTQTIVEAAIDAKSDEIADCVVEMASPV